MPLVNVAWDASPLYAFVLRDIPQLGFKSAFFALKVCSWAQPTCPQVEFGIHLVLGKCLCFTIACLSSLF